MGTRGGLRGPYGGMVSSIVIIVVSSVLFWYWFRYVCLLLLNTVPARDYAYEVAAENNLSFPDISEKLSVAQLKELDAIAHSLHKDYTKLVFLVTQLNQLELGGSSIEHRLLRLNFVLMRAWYRLSRQQSSKNARAALEEMRLVIAQLARNYGEQVMAIPHAG